MARASAAEASNQRMIRLQRMNHYELRALLAGDPAEAALWITSAAEYGLPAAQLRLGRMLLEGLGVTKSPALAFFWFRRAAEQLDGEAMNMVARCYENGWVCRRTRARRPTGTRSPPTGATTGANTTSAICSSTAAASRSISL